MPVVCFSQIMTTVSYRDVTPLYTESITDFYDFDYPINSDVLDAESYIPPVDGVYLKASYGHRYLSTTLEKTDNHGGFDYWEDHVFDGEEYDEENKVPIICMCTGTITEAIDGLDIDLEMTPTGRSVQVTCDKESQAFESSIKINYRHLSALATLPTVAYETDSEVEITKGDTIGLMGDSGTTTNVHLHLSTEAVHPINGNAFVNTARLFNPELYPNVLKPLEKATIELLHRWDSSALFRVVWPYNETINEFEFINDSYSIVFNKEEGYDVGSDTRDNHDCLSGIQVYAYQFNGKQTAKDRYDIEKINMPAIYPASPQRDEDLDTYVYPHYPILNDSVAFVYV